MLIDTCSWPAAADLFVDALRHLILPAIALGSIPLAIIARITRASVIEVTNEDYVRTARAKGLKEKRVDNRHIMRNAWLPVVTVIGLQVGGLLGGAVITETVFSWNGVGRCIVDAIGNRDYLVVQSTILVFALIFLVVNLGSTSATPSSTHGSGTPDDDRRPRPSDRRAPRASRGLWGDAFAACCGTSRPA